MPQTLLEIANLTDKIVKVYLTLGMVKGCVQNINTLPFIEKVITQQQGYFFLEPEDSVEYISPKGIGLNGNVSFGSPPMNCPTEEFKSGINIAEFMLNNSFQGASAQETVDISCVAGVNSIIKFSLIGSNRWNAGPLYPEVLNFQNTVIGENAGLVGVYPYGCDECTKSVNPPKCPRVPLGAPVPPIPQRDPICNVQRNAFLSSGRVVVCFLGFVEDN